MAIAKATNITSSTRPNIIAKTVSVKYVLLPTDSSLFCEADCTSGEVLKAVSLAVVDKPTLLDVVIWCSKKCSSTNTV